MGKFSDEVSAGERFKFGENWSRFLTGLTEAKIGQAELSLKTMLGVESLAGLTFLDAGSGSGLFSLAARRLGARVRSFDFDPASVACTAELRRRFFADDARWTVEEASVLDCEYMHGLAGTFDIVYSWGVLHHTGNMWLAIDNTLRCVKPGGILFIAIYNDQGWKSHLWWMIKATYNRMPSWLAVPFGYGIGYGTKVFVTFRHLLLFRFRIAWNFVRGGQRRGMSTKHNLLDWVGGFPFEFTRYKVLIDYVAAQGLHFVRGTEAGSIGCHEFVFSRDR